MCHVSSADSLSLYPKNSPENWEGRLCCRLPVHGGVSRQVDKPVLCWGLGLLSWQPHRGSAEWFLWSHKTFTVFHGLLCASSMLTAAVGTSPASPRGAGSHVNMRMRSSNVILLYKHRAGFERNKTKEPTPHPAAA